MLIADESPNITISPTQINIANNIIAALLTNKLCLGNRILPWYNVGRDDVYMNTIDNIDNQNIKTIGPITLQMVPTKKKEKKQ